MTRFGNTLLEMLQQAKSWKDSKRVHPFHRVFSFSNIEYNHGQNAGE